MPVKLALQTLPGLLVLGFAVFGVDEAEAVSSPVQPDLFQARFDEVGSGLFEEPAVIPFGLDA